MSAASDNELKALVREQFTRTAEVFGDYAVTHRVTEAERLARMVSAGPNDRAVDLACGPGTLALRFARHVQWICAFDLTPAILALARSNAKKDGLANLACALGDAQALPFGDGSLDIAVTSYSLHHISDPAKVLREMARVVKPGGRVGVLDIVVPEDPKIRELNHRIEYIRDNSHARSLSRSDFDRIFVAAGLRIVATEVHEHPRTFDHWMHVAGWKRTDREYIEARRLMQSSMVDDGADFHPRYEPADVVKPGEEPDIYIVNTGMSIAAEKI
jgi:ubiquinone/menaquinone biosynthesis C-methylase UbiE